MVMMEDDRHDEDIATMHHVTLNSTPLILLVESITTKTMNDKRTSSRYLRFVLHVVCSTERNCGERTTQKLKRSKAETIHQLTTMIHVHQCCSQRHCRIQRAPRNSSHCKATNSDT